MGVYEVFLRDDRGKDKSSFNLTDAGKVSFIHFVGEKSSGKVEIGAVNMNMTFIAVVILFFSPGYQAVMNELFRVIGESLNFSLSKQK